MYAGGCRGDERMAVCYKNSNKKTPEPEAPEFFAYRFSKESLNLSCLENRIIIIEDKCAR
jgi:hypothetical protein